MTAQQAATVLPDQPLFTRRDRQVLLTGSGYGVPGIYYVWLQKPGVNRTGYTGQSFSPIAGGLIPPNTALAIAPTDPYGSYFVSISTSAIVDSSTARTHFGLWGTGRPLYQRTETVDIAGGGLAPVEGKLTVTIRNPDDKFVIDFKLLANALGEFRATWRIPEDAPLGPYTLVIDGVGTFDDSSRNFASRTTFGATAAILKISIIENAAQRYERTQLVSLRVQIQYPDLKPVIRAKPEIKPAELVVSFANRTVKVESLPLTLVDQANGFWKVEAKIAKNATLAQDYRIQVTARGFDDGFGNVGGAEDVSSTAFEVRPAGLRLDVRLNGTLYQAPFDRITLFAKLTYPDGSPVSNATVVATLKQGSWSISIPLTMTRGSGQWAGSYPLSWVDIFRFGAWTIIVEATDVFGNTGSVSLEVGVQPLLLVTVIVALFIIVLLGRWFARLYWRRLQIRLRRFWNTVLKEKRIPIPSFKKNCRLNAVALYLITSPVTPWIRNSLTRIPCLKRTK